MSFDQPVAPKKKNKNKPPKPTTTQLAFRAYARVSYYLATVGVFDFKTDDAAHAFLDEHHSISGMPSRVDEINALTAKRSKGVKVPKGDHIDGLATRTNERMRVYEKPSKKAAA